MQAAEHKKQFRILLVVICIVALSQAFMHINFLVGETERKVHLYNEQRAITDGLRAHNPDFQARLLFPLMVRILGGVIPSAWMSAQYHAGLALVIAEWVSLAFSLVGLFLLSQVIVKSYAKSLLVVLGYSIYLPYIFQLEHRFGEAFIVGFFCFLIYAVITRRMLLFGILLVACSFQRVDIACVGVLFKFVHDCAYSDRKNMTLLLTLLYGVIPVIIIMGISRYYQLETATFWSGLVRQNVVNNIHHLPVVFFYYAPVIIIAMIRWHKFNKIIFMMLACLVPYLTLVFMVGGINETRLLHPVIVTLVIGIISSFRDADMHDFINT